MPQDETTTPAPVQDTPAPVVDDDGNNITAEQEREQTTTGADQTEEDASQSSDTGETAPDEGGSESTPDGDETTTDEAGNAADDPEYREWAAKKNLPDDPTKLGKMLYNAERELGRKGQEAGELKKAVTAANSEVGTDEVQSLRNEVDALNFKLAHPEAITLEPVMIDILDERPYLAGDLEAVLEMAKGRSVSAPQQVADARKAGGKEALSAAERAARAAPPRASANTREEASPYMSDAEAGALSTADYQKAKAEGRIRPW